MLPVVSCVPEQLTHRLPCSGKDSSPSVCESSNRTTATYCLIGGSKVRKSLGAHLPPVGEEMWAGAWLFPALSCEGEA